MTQQAGMSSRARLLVVDDDRLVLTTLASGLERLGYQVTAAASREAALHASDNAEFDLAILDVHLDPDDGVELAQELRTRRSLPILFLSAHGDRAYVDRAVREGGLAYVVKPITPVQLAPTIETALARGQDMRELRRSEAALRDALARERQVSMAVGVMMERQRIGSREAFEILRRRARRERRRLADLAVEITGSAEVLNHLTQTSIEPRPSSEETPR